MPRTAVLRALLLTALLLTGLVALPAQASSQVAGPDVSKYQHDNGGPIDWRAVRAAGQSFAFIKATGGSDRVDPWFAREWAAAGAAGIVRGAYHYADPSGNADAQAAFVVRTVGSTRESGNLGIALDLETTGGLSPRQLVAWAHAFLNGVERRTGRTPIVYTYPAFWQNAMAGDRGFGAYPLWLARYAASAPAPLPGWSQWTFWQHSSSSRLPGIPGVVDHNVMCCGPGTLAALADGRSRQIAALWRQYGGASGELGLPLGPETAVPGGWGQTFQNGFVSMSKVAGMHLVLAPVWERYRVSRGPSGGLGLPTGQAFTESVGGRVVTEQVFQGGRIVSSPSTGARIVHAAVLTRWLKDGGVRSSEGLPKAEQSPTGQQFVLGGLYVTPGGVRLVPGAIRDRYEELGGSGSALGLPTSDAVPLGKLGWVVTFERGQLTEFTLGGRHLVV